MFKNFTSVKTIPGAIILGVIIWGYGEITMLAGKAAWDVLINPYVEFNYNTNNIVTSKVVARVNDQIYVGYASGDINGTGKIKIFSTKNSEIQCMGSFKYVSRKLLAGKGIINCNDGAIATFSFQGRDQVSGQGYGTSNLGPVYFTYGYSPEESAKFIHQPVNYIKKYY